MPASERVNGVVGIIWHKGAYKHPSRKIYQLLPTPGTRDQVTNLKPLSVTNPRDFLIRVRDFNRSIPSNVFLLGGDAVNLELMAPSLEQKRQKEISKESIFCYNPWVYIASCVRYFIEGFENMKGVTTDGDSDWVVFIDTNPSFSIFTEMAIVAAQRLIIPANADDFSREAIKATLSLVYGDTSDEKSGNFMMKQ